MSNFFQSIKLIVGLTLIVLHTNVFGQNTCIVKGKITNSEGYAIPFANVIVEGTNWGVAADAHGVYSVKVEATDSTTLSFSALGYSTITLKIHIKGKAIFEQNIELVTSASSLDEVLITTSHRRFGNIERINHKDIEFLPDASGSFESILKSLPGVSSSNELSSQYSVRGGNFDENLVYVNDIEIYRPFLVRSGQQEGLSFINSDMVDGVEFSAGGFNAEYGDKMSSILNIRYRQPSENRARAEVSLLGASGLIEGIGKNENFSYLTGVRYKTSKYMLSTLDEGGDYTPVFIDIQSNLAYRFSKKFRLSFLGNLSANNYQFAPDVRETRFGSFTNALQLKVYYEGQEVNSFRTIQGAATAEYRPTEKSMLKLIGSVYSATEAETFDILGQYLLNELDNTLGSTTYGDSSINVGIGGFLNHARNFLFANFYRVEHLGSNITKTNTTKWGIRYQYESIEDMISEWSLIDSSGYAVPYNGENLQLSYSLKSSNTLASHRVNGFLQNSNKKSFDIGELTTTAGLRFTYWSFNNQLIISPRATVMFKPDWERDIAFHISGGFYHQPPTYKEFRLPNGEINNHIKAQESIHAVLGIEYLFEAWDRPFRFQTEVYYKHLKNLIPYKVDNVRIQYAGQNLAKGYVQGIDFKVNGEFVDGAESWASLSLMKTYEDIKGDSYEANGQTVYPGYYPRPTDQRFSIGAFFQDFIPSNPSYRVHLTGFYGSRLPFSVPRTERYDIVARMPSYKRVDIGFTKIFKDEKVKTGEFLKNKPWIKSLWVGAEIFNLFDFKNTISYLWVQTVSNQSNESGTYAVPNYLTSRRINVKLSVKF
ncbi:MAG: TonB-dependent receptor [Tenuifilaceae bacterium]|nr:TonB-dependent receptor [Tenuifilaceae bacterium]